MNTPDPSQSDPEQQDYAEPGYKPKTTGHPTGFWFFFWGEFAERCSYYGMRAILPLYMTSRLGFADDDTASWYSYFKAVCYLLPLLGGYLADRFFGKYWTIVGFSIPYIVGQLVIGTVEQFPAGFEQKAMLFLAFALLAGGSGVIKPNISALMGLTYDQQRSGKTQLRANAFLWFYFSINVGSTLSMLALPVVRNHYGYQNAFLIPAALMALALAVFAAGKRYYATETIGPRPPVGPAERAEQRRVLASLFGIFGLMVFFWVAYEHNDNLWVFFARDHMDLTAPSWVPDWFTREVEVGETKQLQEFEFEGTKHQMELIVPIKQKQIAPDQFQFINAALILILVPFSTWFWPRVDPTGRRFPHAAKMLIGFLFTAGAPAAMVAAAILAGDGDKVSKFWIVLAYFLVTVGEVLVYGTGLDLSYAYAPARMKGFVTACFLLTIFLGNLINTQFTKFYEKLPGWWPLGGRPLSASEFFALDVGIVLAAAVAFFFVGRKFSRAHGTTVSQA